MHLRPDEDFDITAIPAGRALVVAAPRRRVGLLAALRRRRPAPRLPDGLRLYAIGDVHGRADLLDALLACVREDDAARPPAETWVVLLGDLIDRGPASDAVVRRAMAPLGWARLRAIKGNHEAALLRAIDGDLAMLDLWLANGGVPTAIGWGVDPALLDGGSVEDIAAAVRAAVPADVRVWLERCPLSIHVGDYLLVHAGVRPGVTLADQCEADMLWIRDSFLESRRPHGAVIVHGHSPSPGIEDVPGLRIGVDTGAYATGRLSAVGLDGVHRWFLDVAA